MLEDIKSILNIKKIHLFSLNDLKTFNHANGPDCVTENSENSKSVESVNPMAEDDSFPVKLKSAGKADMSSLLAVSVPPQPHVPRLLELCNDVEKNPGPFSKGFQLGGGNSGGRKGKIVMDNRENMPTKCREVEDLKNVMEKQNEIIEKQKAEIQALRKAVEDNDRKASDFRAELAEVRKNLQQSLSDVNTKGSSESSTLSSKVDNLMAAYNDIQDRLYEIDKSWKNNLIFYGVPVEQGMEDDPFANEDKVRELIKKKLRISREIPFNRVTRIQHGPEFRGHKPVQVHFVSYNDKEEVLRKSKLLRGSNIHISEDFSRKVREHRQELIKFMKEIRSRDPARRMVLRYDKLYMGRDVFFFNDSMGRVEKLHQHIDTGYSMSNALEGVITADAQQAHDSSWLRRPRSKIGTRSRAQTPVLSRKNSISMDDMSNSEDFYGTPQPTPMRTRPFTSRGRVPRSMSSDSVVNQEFPRGSPTKPRNNLSSARNGKTDRRFANNLENGKFPRQPNHQINSKESVYTSSEDDIEDGLTAQSTVGQDDRTPSTPKRTPSKQNPLLRLATVPRSAKEREKKSVNFREEKKKLHQNGVDSSEGEDDEVLKVEVDSREVPQDNQSKPPGETESDVTPPPPPVSLAVESEAKSQVVPLFPPVTVTNSTISSPPVAPNSLVPYNEKKSSGMTEITSYDVKTGSSPRYLNYNNAHQKYQPIHHAGETNHYSYGNGYNKTTVTSLTHSSGGENGSTGERSLLKLNVAIAGEFSVGGFSDCNKKM